MVVPSISAPFTSSAHLPDRIAAIPAGRDLVDVPEVLAFGTADVGDLDHRAGILFAVETSKTSKLSANGSFLPDHITKGQRPVVERLVVLCPVQRVGIWLL